MVLLHRYLARNAFRFLYQRTLVPSCILYAHIIQPLAHNFGRVGWLVSRVRCLVGLVLTTMGLFLNPFSHRLFASMCRLRLDIKGRSDRDGSQDGAPQVAQREGWERRLGPGGQQCSDRLPLAHL